LNKGDSDRGRERRGLETDLVMLVQQMQEKLHMQYRVVDGVEQFTRL